MNGPITAENPVIKFRRPDKHSIRMVVFVLACFAATVAGFVEVALLEHSISKARYPSHPRIAPAPVRQTCPAGFDCGSSTRMAGQNVQPASRGE